MQVKCQEHVPNPWVFLAAVPSVSVCSQAKHKSCQYFVTVIFISTKMRHETASVAQYKAGGSVNIPTVDQ
jgi:hypothetical protein